MAKQAAQAKQGALLDFEGMRLLRGLHELGRSPVLVAGEQERVERVFRSVCERYGLHEATANDLLDQLAEGAP